MKASKKTILLPIAAMLASIASNLTIAQESEPAEAIKKWSVAIGHWVNEEQHREGPDQPWESATSEWTIRFLPGGYFVESPGKIRFSSGREVSWEQIWGHDPVEKSNYSTFFNSVGNQGYGTFRWTEDGITEREGIVKRPDGTVVRMRSKAKYSARSMELTIENYSDGKWWLRRKVKGRRVD